MQTTLNLMQKIETSYNQFTKAEKKVANFIMANKEQAIYMSITELSNSCDVGETSVYRFCRTLGYDGYQEFKMQLSLYLASISNRTKEVPDESKLDLEKERMLVQVKAIRDTFELLDRDTIFKIVELIENTETIYIFGVGDSFQTAQDMWNKFIRITPKVRIISDAHMQTMAASMLTDKDLMILVSYSGATKDIVNIAKVSKESGASVVGITRYQKSPLTAYTDVILLCGSKESPLEGGSLVVKMSQLYLIDVLYQTYYKRNSDESRKNQQRSSQAVVDKLY